jgi:hypothetical protein
MNVTRTSPFFLAAASSLLAPVVWAAPAALPQKQIPPAIVREVRDLESRFDSALLHDCAPERCVSKGCLYREHVVVDMPRNSSLPGLPQEEGPGSAPAQEYLTEAQCDFAHEKSVSARDVSALVKRLEQRLSKGWLKVTVGRELLEPISADLGLSPLGTPTPVPAATPVATPAPLEWNRSVAARELWLSLLPHFSWMVAVLLATLATLAIIWAARRLGRESIEEKLMLAQLGAGTLEEEKKQPEPLPAADTGANGANGANGADHGDSQRTPDEADAAYVDEQQRVWTERIAQADLTRDESVVLSLLQQWLKAGEFALLLKAIRVFGDKLSLAFPSDGELAARKVEFADYLRNIDGHALPSDAEFFRTLDHHAISSSLLSQHDADLYRSIREDFGSTGVANVMDALPPRHAALLFAMVPPDIQHEVTRGLKPEAQSQLASQLLLSNRVSTEERAHLFAALDAARKGKALPVAPPAGPNGIVDLGREYDAPGALSVLLTHVPQPIRQVLFQEALKKRNGAFPFWYFNILYPDMLLHLPDEARSDLLLEVDVKALAGWCSIHDARWQEAFLAKLNPSLQRAVRTNMAFPSRAEQLQLARRGRAELVEGLKRVTALGKTSFVELVA